jgi:PRC-barrel domain
MRHMVLAAFAAMLLTSSANAETKPASPDAGFVTQQPNDRLASRLIGLNIQNSANETIGEIHDIVLTDANAVRAIIVSVGGFLGIGTRYVAIDPKAITFDRQDERNWKAVMKTTKDQLRAAPEYKWQSEWRRR